jgi:hypothetical protein
VNEDDVIHAIEYIRVQAQDAIDTLRRLRHDVEEEQARLMELHEIKAAADTLGALIAKHDAERMAFNNEILFMKRSWEHERLAIHRARELDESEYRQRKELARVEDSVERAQLRVSALNINPCPIIRRVVRARTRSKNGSCKIKRS